MAEYADTSLDKKSLDAKISLVYLLDTTMTGKELRRARLRLKMTQKQLGEALDIHKNSVARMERGEFKIIRTTELAVKYLLLVEIKKGG